MTAKQAQKIFEKYNPVDKVSRCPNGYAEIRRLLNIYAKASVNLYGIIAKKELAEIFSKQNRNLIDISADEVFSLLLPLVVKSKDPWYCFYKEYIVHYWAMDDFSYADNWLFEQGDKPRFIPAKDEFLKFENQYHISKSQVAYWDKLRDFVFEEWGDSPSKYRFYHDLQKTAPFAPGFSNVSKALKKYDLIFASQESAQEFFNLYTNASNNTRMWVNKGHTPDEMQKLYAEKRQKKSDEIIIQQPKKVGPNQPCPCGSGKKYKKCCGSIETSDAARLSTEECKLFYETWYKLLNFVNQKRNIVDYKFSLKYPDYHDETLLHKIREILWENPKLIDEFINSAAELSDEEISLLRSWKKYYIKGQFILLKYELEYAVLMRVEKGKPSKLYAVKGMTSSIAEAMSRRLPVMLETVLLPFGDKIIYDSFMASHTISFGSGIRNMFDGEYAQSQEKYGIITTL